MIINENVIAFNELIRQRRISRVIGENDDGTNCNAQTKMIVAINAKLKSAVFLQQVLERGREKLSKLPLQCPEINHAHHSE